MHSICVSPHKRIQVLLWLFVAGLAVSGLTAIPLLPEIDWLVHRFVADPSKIDPGGLGGWLLFVQAGLHDASNRYPFLFYGTDWLAFGHFVIAIAFIGPIRDPIKNIWVIQFGLIASMLVIPFALIFGEVRGIPFAWRLIDCSFGLAGILATGLAYNWIRKLEQTTATP